MAVHRSTSDISFEVGEYEEFSRRESGKAPVKTWRSTFQRLSVVLLGLGLICVVQAILNICLRLTLRDSSVALMSTPTPTPTPTPSPVTRTLTTPVSATTDAGVERCPENWLKFDSSCYYVSSERKDWDNSRQDCLQRGADLVVIDNRREQAFLARFAVAVWVGMNDRKKEGRFVWVDRNPVIREKIQWAPGQPDNSNGGEDCGDLRNQGNFKGLNDFKCAVRLPWICEKKPIDVSEMTVTNAASTAPTVTPHG